MKSIEHEDLTSDFMQVCKWLTDEIQVFSGTIENITGIHLIFSSFMLRELIGIIRLFPTRFLTCVRSPLMLKTC